ncbi:MAG: RidA family protein [Sphaerochaetaceae bacterium]|jgi:2-iminobutanoate/2-iminopropanoate deaminase
MNTIVHSDKAPQAVGPYSQAIATNNMLFVSGQLPIDPATGEFAGSSIEEQTEQVIANLKAVIAEAGFSLAEVVKTTCFLQSMEDFAIFNSIYATYFSSFPPARECVEVAKLPKGALVEISVICSK